MKQITDIKTILLPKRSEFNIALEEHLESGWELFNELSLSGTFIKGGYYFYAILVKREKIQTNSICIDESPFLAKSERKIVDYRIVTLNYEEDCRDTVKRLLIEGWELLGEARHSLDRDGDNQYMQTMVKYSQ